MKNVTAYQWVDSKNSIGPIPIYLAKGVVVYLMQHLEGLILPIGSNKLKTTSSLTTPSLSTIALVGWFNSICLYNFNIDKLTSFVLNGFLNFNNFLPIRFPSSKDKLLLWLIFIIVFCPNDSNSISFLLCSSFG